jgi:RHS repeat-associated protein
MLRGDVVFGSYVDEPLMMKAGGSKYYYATNHLYSVAALTDSTGAVVERYKYDAYGKQGIMNTNGTVSYCPSDYGNFVGFTGRYHDWETGLVYFRARYYDTGLGRFIGRDPKEYINGMGLYGAYYVPNNLDPSGKDYISPIFNPNGITPFQWFLDQAIRACVLWQKQNNPNYTPTFDDHPTCPKSSSSPSPQVDCQRAALAAIKDQHYELWTHDQWLAYVQSYNAAVDKYNDVQMGNLVTSVGIGAVSGAIGAAGQEIVTVVHFTDSATAQAIEASGAIRAGSYVTLPGEIPVGSSAAQVESILEIRPGSGAASATVEVQSSSLITPPNGTTTSGGAVQFQTTTPIPVGPGSFVPTP